MPVQHPSSLDSGGVVATVTDTLAERFPDHTREQIAELVTGVYTRLAGQSRITDHLAVLVQHEVIDLLRTS